MASSVTHLSFREKFSYGLGDFASNLYWQTFMLYMTYFYTDIFGLAAAATATMFLVNRIVDAITDPVMGMVADHTTTRWGRFRPWLLWTCVPFAIMGVLAFTTPSFGSGGKLAWAYGTFFGMMLVYTIINIPYTALMGVISGNSEDRTSISSFKFMFAFGAGLVVSATLLPMVRLLGAGNEAQGWQWAFWIYGGIAVLAFLLAFAGTRERIQPPADQQVSIRKDLSSLLHNRPWWILTAVTLSFILFVAVRGSVTVHYFKYVVGNQMVTLPWLQKEISFEDLVSAFNALGQAACLIGVLGVGWFSAKVGKKAAFLILLTISSLGTALFFFLPGSQIQAIFFLQFLCSLTGGPLSVLLWAMYADTADFAEWKHGRRATGLIFSASTMSQKVGWAFGAFFALQAMAVSGFFPNQAQTAQSELTLRILFSFLPASLGLFSALLVACYPLGEKMMESIAHDLSQRRRL